MKKILIDVFGSDHPEQLLEGCARCTLEVPDVMLVLQVNLLMPDICIFCSK